MSKKKMALIERAAHLKRALDACHPTQVAWVEDNGDVVAFGRMSTQELQYVRRCIDELTRIGRASEIAEFLSKGVLDPPFALTPAIDQDAYFDALYDRLVKEKMSRLAVLARFMKNREMATFQEIMDGAYLKDMSEGTIRSYASRLNTYLLGLGSKLWFETTQARVVKHFDLV